ncbi:MAG TPA: STAS-like domain-containing protein [Clostridiaceae bacterium]|nr:STAS-like domain-containing protein [Clostridiaceae bacterium]
MNIKLAHFIGERCITAEQGQKLLAEIKPLLLAGETVTIDLAGVKTLLSLFLNNAIGPLFKHFDRQQLDRLLSFANPSESQTLTLDLVMESAEAYHRNPVIRKAVDDTLSRLLEETMY